MGTVYHSETGWKRVTRPGCSSTLTPQKISSRTTAVFRLEVEGGGVVSWNGNDTRHAKTRRYQPDCLETLGGKVTVLQFSRLLWKAIPPSSTTAHSHYPHLHKSDDYNCSSYQNTVTTVSPPNNPPRPATHPLPTSRTPSTRLHMLKQGVLLPYWYRQPTISPRAACKHRDNDRLSSLVPHALPPPLSFWWTAAHTYPKRVLKTNL